MHAISNTQHIISITVHITIYELVRPIICYTNIYSGNGVSSHNTAGLPKK